MAGIVGFIGMMCLILGASWIGDEDKRTPNGFIVIVLGLMLLAFAGGMM